MAKTFVEGQTTSFVEISIEAGILLWGFVEGNSEEDVCLPASARKKYADKRSTGWKQVMLLFSPL
jgi:hypothetical protein